jgi:hypothetical protein
MLGALLLGNTQGAGCSWNQRPFGSALNRRLFCENTPLLGCYPTQKSNSKQFVLLMEGGTYVETNWTRANQLTLQDGWCVDRKHFFIEFLSGTNHPRTPTYLIVTYSLTYLLRYVVIIYIPIYQ